MIFLRLVLLVSSLIISTFGQNPSILEDARLHPTSDGNFGFLYRTQDGITHAAKGAPGGAVSGRFTYTDPTGLKVNYNYNAGAQAVKQKQQQTHYSNPVDRYQPLQYEQSQYQSPPYQPTRQSLPAQQNNMQRYTEVQYEQYNNELPRQDSSQSHNQYRPKATVRNDIYNYNYEPKYSQ